MANRDNLPQRPGIAGVLALGAVAAMLFALLVFSRGDRVDTTNQRFEPPPTTMGQAGAPSQRPVPPAK